ncbi:hypothetical protein AK812_SmicGene39384 [Symbiodinium microadriaticum]|uniref:USP domain-containing protein n=1 Tax=Symbiodinium microadriaticum TaxID=2951 RepID=A0A1Q9CBD7_SYMMI|nr:hypothetical protein AK812_SmicGene39384 [Symbiodinium microadriaticum]
MHLSGDGKAEDLQDCVDRWHQQAYLHGLCEAYPVVLVQLARYGYGALGAIKDRSGVSVPRKLFLPVFGRGLNVFKATYTVCSIIVHHGTCTSAGHYTSLLLEPGVLPRNTFWGTDDGKVAKSYGRFPKCIERDAYIFILARCRCLLTLVLVASASLIRGGYDNDNDDDNDNNNNNNDNNAGAKGTTRLSLGSELEACERARSASLAGLKSNQEDQEREEQEQEQEQEAGVGDSINMDGVGGTDGRGSGVDGDSYRTCQENSGAGATADVDGDDEEEVANVKVHILKAGSAKAWDQIKTLERRAADPFPTMSKSQMPGQANMLRIRKQRYDMLWWIRKFVDLDAEKLATVWATGHIRDILESDVPLQLRSDANMHDSGCEVISDGDDRHVGSEVYTPYTHTCDADDRNVSSQAAGSLWPEALAAAVVDCL